MSCPTIRLDLFTWVYGAPYRDNPYREMRSSLYITGLDESQYNHSTESNTERDTYRPAEWSLTNSEAVAVAQAIMVFNAIPLDEIMHNDWAQYLE